MISILVFILLVFLFYKCKKKKKDAERMLTSVIKLNKDGGVWNV